MILTRKYGYRTIRLLFSIGLLFVAACKKTAVSASVQSPAVPAQISMPVPRPAVSAVPDTAGKSKKDAEFQRLVEKRYAAPAEAKAVLDDAAGVAALGDAEDKLAELHRRTMVVEAPADFKPEPVARKVRLRLVLEKTALRSGELPRFRLEMTNVGRETIEYEEGRASFFVKNAGVLDSLTMRFYLTDSQGKRTVLLPKAPPASFQSRGPHNAEYLPDDMPKEEKEKWLKETDAMSAARATFKIKLLPGETLHSIGDDDSPQEYFRTLFSRGRLEKPGTYQLEVRLDDRPEPLTRKYIEVSLQFRTLKEIHESHERRLKNALGPVASNVVAFRVEP